MIHTIIQYFVDMVANAGYTGIVILMAMESSILPVPSEIVMPPAGYLVSQGRMDGVIVVLCGTAGSIIGALFNYGMAVFFGRALLHRYGKYILLTSPRLDKMDEFFHKHGEITTFTGRMLPAVRHLISIPAGLSRMNLGRFMFFTGLGSGIWALVLMMLGYIIGDNIENIKSHLHIITAVTAAVLALIIFVYIKVRKTA